MRGDLNRCLALAAFGALLGAHPALAQSEHVFRITASQCRLGNDRVLTGFRDRAQRGIVTALHGVVGCASVVAVIPGTPPQSYPVEVRMVDVANDLALLGSSTLDREPMVGLEAAAGTPAGALRVIGYPHALPRPLVTRASLRDPAAVTLNELLPSGLANDGAFRTRQSPHPRITVLSVEGHLTLGYSGAPILDERNRVIGVANGGLASGALEISWAVPYSGRRVAWAMVNEARRVLDRLELLDSELVFSFAAESPRLPPIRCFGMDLDYVRSSTLAQLITTVDDPLTYSQLLHYYQLTDALVALDLFRDRESRVTLVVPRGWRVSEAGGHCHLRPPTEALHGVPPFSVVFRLAPLQGGDPVVEITNRVQQVVQPEFFSRGWSVDPTGSNWMPRFAIHRGIVAQRISYVKIDRFCGPFGLPPLKPEDKPWNAQPPQILNNAPFCPNGALYPDVWIMPGVHVPPGYFSGSGFGSFMGSGRDVLIATLKAEGATLGSEMASCVWQLQESAHCRRLYTGQRLFALGVVAATASTLAPSERK